MSLRLKLLLAASLLLTVPVAGYRFVLAMEAFLRANQTETAASTARTLAGALQTGDLLPALPAPEASRSPGPQLHVHPLAAAPQVDGYPADWAELSATRGRADTTLRAGSRDGALFLLLSLPPSPSVRERPRAVRIVFEDAPQLRRAWLVDLDTPGPVPVLEVPPAPGATAPAHRDTRVVAAVGHDAQATILELRMPTSLRAPRLYVERIGTDPEFVARFPPGRALRVVMPPAGLQRALDALDGVPGRRLRVTDVQGRVLAQAGSLDNRAARSRLALLMESLLEPDEDSLLSLAPDTLSLDGPEIASAVNGTPAARLRRDATQDTMVVVAAHPLSAAGDIRGVLVLEESTSAIQALARRALLELIATAGFAFVAGTAWLLFVAGRTAARLSELRDQARRSVDDDGRVRQSFEASGARDEIGDLGRSFESAVSRLKGYQDYLEQLARRLSHELRTPITVIRSSLENMALDVAPDAPEAPLMARARSGVERLDGLIRRMSEATRLEHAMSDTERVRVDVSAMATSVVAAHAGAWEGISLAAHCPAQPLWVDASPDLLLQALDKLLANARDFAAPGTQVTLRVAASGSLVDLGVENEGPALPPGTSERLFDSMVSERDAHDDVEPHLGLGLYIVRLVARFHAGREYAENVTANGTVTGVRVGMRLPRAAAEHG